MHIKLVEKLLKNKLYVEKIKSTQILPADVL